MDFHIIDDTVDSMIVYVNVQVFPQYGRYLNTERMFHRVL